MSRQMRRAFRWCVAATLFAVSSVALSAVWNFPLPAAPKFATEAHAPIGGHQIWYRDTGGTGTPVIFMHARTGSSQSWDYQVPAFVAAGFRVIVWDRLGTGKSTLDAGAQVGSATEDLEGLVNFLGIDRFHLVATAAGGFTANDYALTYPRRLRTLTLANTLGGIADKDYAVLQQQIRPPNFNTLPPEVRELSPAYRAANLPGMKRWIELEHLSSAPVPLEKPQLGRSQVTFEQLSELKMPVLLLTGGADLFWPEPLLRVVAGHIRHAQTVVVPDAGHSVYWEQPELFNQSVIRFLRRN